MKLNDVSAIYCINMDYCTGPGSRWERMERRLKNVRPCVQRFSAVTAASADGRVFQQRAVAGNNLSIGGLGCAFSHLDLWAHIANLPTAPAQNSQNGNGQLFLILEDDVFFQRDWVNLVNADLEHFKKLALVTAPYSAEAETPFFYMLNGAGFIDFTMNESPDREGLFSISQNGGIVYYTGGYIVNRAACQKLVDKFGALSVPSIVSKAKITASDHMTKWLQETFGGGWPNSTLEDRVGNCFFRYPWLAMQECYESFIQPDKHLETIRDFNVNKYFPNYGHLYDPQDITRTPAENQEHREYADSLLHPHHRLTLCTMFYDLGRREKNTARRQKDEYLRFGDFVLSLPYNLVIFTEPDMENYMWQRRKELFPHESMPATLVVARPFDKLPFFRDISPMEPMEPGTLCGLVQLARDNWKRAKPVFPHKLTADYSLMCCGRPSLVAEVAEWNPFQSTHFGWIDFGCDHISNLSENYRNKSPQPTSLPFYLPADDKLWIPRKNDPNENGGQFDLRFASTNLLDQVLGTFFCGTRRAVTTYAGLFSHALQHAVFHEDLCPTDEPLATWLSLLFPSLFQCFQTDWPMLLADACTSHLTTKSVTDAVDLKSQKPETTSGVVSTEGEASDINDTRRDYEKFMGAGKDAEAGAVRELLWKLVRASDMETILSPAEISAVYIEGFARLWYRFPERRQEECRALARHHMRFLERDLRPHGHDLKAEKAPHVMVARKNVERIRYNWQFLEHGKDLLDRLNHLVKA